MRSGRVVFISHGRWFLDRIATHILAFEGRCKVTLFDGNASEYMDWRKRTLGEAPPPDEEPGTYSAESAQASSIPLDAYLALSPGAQGAQAGSEGQA